MNHFANYLLKFKLKRDHDGKDKKQKSFTEKFSFSQSYLMTVLVFLGNTIVFISEIEYT